MRVRELIEILNNLVEGLDESIDPEVKYASQPSWPMEYDISRVELVELEVDAPAPEGIESAEFEDVSDQGPVYEPEIEHFVYLVEGHQEYLKSGVSEQIGWR